MVHVQGHLREFKSITPMGEISVIPTRYVFAFISCLGFVNVYAMRVNLSVALVAMVGEQSEYTDKEDIACKELLTSTLDNFTLHSNMTIMRHGEFNWDSTIQAQILASFFYGYVVTQIPGGIIAEKFGAKWLYGLGVLITAIFTLLTPIAARSGVEFLIAVRIIEGLGEGVTYPAMNALIGRWVPINERSRISTIIYCGSPIGTVVSFAVSGYLSSSYRYGGWPMVFYLFGSLGCLWFIFCIFLIYESPEEHPGISKSELQYIQSGQDRLSHSRSGRIPWLSILSSGPFWALAVTHFGFDWGIYTLLTELPTYLANILHFDLERNGLLSALPYLFQALFGFIVCVIADKMRSTGRYKITTIRKIINSIAFFIPCVLLACISYVGCDSTVIVTLVLLAVAFSGLKYSGFNVTHVDMSPEFAGTLLGITNSLANMTGFLAPLFVGYVTQTGVRLLIFLLAVELVIFSFINNLQTIENWRTVFLTTSGIYLGTGLIYVFFASSELQPWGISTTSTSLTDEEAASGEKKKSSK